MVDGDLLDATAAASQCWDQDGEELITANMIISALFPSTQESRGKGSLLIGKGLAEYFQPLIGQSHRVRDWSVSPASAGITTAIPAL